MKAGLFNPDSFKDNCGFGLIAHMQGEPSHDLLETAIEALTCMTHRGGINADGKTGDGCGLLMQKPDAFLRAIAQEQFGAELPEQYAAGVVFFNQDEARAEQARANMNLEIEAAGLKISGPRCWVNWPWPACRASSRCSSPVPVSTISSSGSSCSPPAAVPRYAMPRTPSTTSAACRRGSSSTRA